MSERKQQDQDKFIVRLPDGMRDAIKESALRNSRSMNSEIVHALEQYLSPWRNFDPGPDDEGSYDPAEDPNYQPLPPEAREALRAMIDQIKDDAERRFNQWFWAEPNSSGREE